MVARVVRSAGVSAKLAVVGLGLSLGGLASTAYSDSLTQALSGGTVSGDFRLRYESSDQDNAAKDASALTLRSRLAYTTQTYSKFSATIEFEDVRIVGGTDSYSVPPAGFKTGEYSVIADPEVSELDQGFVQYKDSMLTAKLGRQVITYDGHRFVGHVGWRQDRQTFDAMRIDLAPVEGLKLSYSYIDQRNRIFAEAADQDAKDHLLNLAYASPIGKVVVYSYNLETDDSTDNSLDTVGVSLNGGQSLGEVKVLYALELAKQDFELGSVKRDADYSLIEVGAVVSGITAKLGVETLGSDDGLFGFSTPLATLHKFNGYADIFLKTPATGLVDTYLSVSGKLLGGKWAITQHQFAADEDTPTLDDYGSELNISYAKKFGKHYNAGIKYASYNADDLAADTDKIWAWVGLTF